MAFEAKALAKDGIAYAPVPPRYRTPYFNHIMGGYAAGYYASIWPEVLVENTTQWIKDNGGLKRENGNRFRATQIVRAHVCTPDTNAPLEFSLLIHKKKPYT